MLIRQSVVALALALTLGVGSSLRAQYSQMSQPGSWGGGGGYGGGYAGGYGGGYQGGGYYPTGGFGGGGGGYGMHPANLSLIARQSEDVHRQIGDLLDQMRRIQGQQVAVTTPFHTVNDDFFERIGVGFGFNINSKPFNPNGGTQVVGLMPDGSVNPTGQLQFRQGGVDSALPQFGGHDAASDANFGYGVFGSEGGMLFNFFGGQGSNRSHILQEPRVTLHNGAQGFVSDTSQTPFVTGLIPVVGGYGVTVPTPYYPVSRPSTYSPLQDRIRQYKAQQQQREEAIVAGRRPPPLPEAHPTSITAPPPQLSEAEQLSLKAIESRGSTAGHGDLSVAEIKRRRAERMEADSLVDQAELLTLIERGRGAEAAGKLGVAKIYYQQAARRADGDRKSELLQKIAELSE